MQRKRQTKLSTFFNTPLRLLIGSLSLSAIFLVMATMLNKRLLPVYYWRLYVGKYSALRPYIVAMSKLESGNYTNRLSREIYNIFSMRFPKIRPAKNIGSVQLNNVDGGNFLWSVYDSYQMAVDDLFLWMDYTKFPTKVSGPDQFVKELQDRKYFTASYNDYLNGLKSFL